ncbi:MAG: FAD-binding protein, partial [Eudoraea sp.]|nr:FAD-binding protein [Eudoraea sp.]
MKTVKELSQESITQFAALLRGSLVMPTDSNYNETRKVYNGMIDKHPGMFVMCEDVADVMATVNFARENNILLAIRGGGHNGGGLGICDDGLVLDLSLIKYIRVDTSDNTVRVGGGNLWGEVDHATHPFG